MTTLSLDVERELKTADRGYSIDLKAGRANFESKLGTTDVQHQVKTSFHNGMAAALKFANPHSNCKFDWMLGL